MKIGIVGAGQVGSATAFTLVMEHFVSEIILVDKNTARAKAEAADIAHGHPFGRRDVIRSGDYDALKGADLIILTAGAPQKVGQSRLDLLETNVRIFEEIVPKVVKHAPNALILVASNPIDIMTEIALTISGHPAQRVFGTGTSLDSARFKVELGQYLEVSPLSIQASVIGEHGDSEVPLWSNVSIESLPLEEFAKKVGKKITPEIQQKLSERVKNSAYEIIKGKGATFYGIAGTISRICRRITLDEQNVIMLSTHHDSIGLYKDICISSPAILGRTGIQKQISFHLLPNEEEAFLKSAEIIAENTALAKRLLKKFDKN